MIFRNGLCEALALFTAGSVSLPSASATVRASRFFDQQTIGRAPFPSLLDADLEQLVTGLETGQFTSVDLVNAYVARIMEVNSTLHMVTELNPDALAIAADLDRVRQNGTVLGPLHGIPVLIKNNIATKDKMNNTAGSWALIGARVPEDSTMAAKLRKAGAVILGKSNLSQWANYRSFNSSNGWSAHGGQTKGAYYPNQDPSGSSSGSGVSSSLGLAWASLGTETDGSILSPSGQNNLVGIKPTVGLTSRYLVIPISEHQDTVGPMARTVKDAAYLLSSIAGPDPKDNYTAASPFAQNSKPMPDYAAACDYFALRGARIGVPRNLIDTTSDPSAAPIIPVFDAALDILRAAGATVIDNITLPGVASIQSLDPESLTLQADFVTNLAGYFAKLTHNPNNISSLSELQAWTQSQGAREAWPSRDTLEWDAALTAAPDGNIGTDSSVWGNLTLQRYLAGRLGITGALQNYSLDALVIPTEFASSLPAQIGSPAVTVPLGAYPNGTEVQMNGFGDLVASAPGVPFGISFLGGHWEEEKLIGLAYAFEQRTMVRGRVRPYLSPRTEVEDVVRTRWDDV